MTENSQPQVKFCKQQHHLLSMMQWARMSALNLKVCIPDANPLLYTMLKHLMTFSLKDKTMKNRCCINKLKETFHESFNTSDLSHFTLPRAAEKLCLLCARMEAVSYVLFQ